MYAFGMTIYEGRLMSCPDGVGLSDAISQVLSGERPFPRYSSAQLITAVIVRDERPPPLPEESLNGEPYAWVWTVAERCWNTNPQDRPTAADVVDALHPDQNPVSK